MVMAFILAFLNCTFPVYADDIELEVPGIEISGISDMETRGIMCSLFGHKVVYSHSEVNTSCVRVGDASCRVQCFVEKECERCDDLYEYTYMHGVNDCTRNYTDQGLFYTCTLDHTF